MRGIVATHAIALLGVTAASASGQTSFPAPDAFLDSTAARIYASAVSNWRTLDESIVRYTATIDQRIAAAIRTPLKDRIIYRNETAVRAFWDQDYDAVVQVLGTRSQYPGRGIAVREGDLDWLDDLPFDEPFQPGGDRLFFGLTDEGEEAYQPDNEDFWFAHPLAAGADSLYRFQSGDTLTLSFPDGRRLHTVQLDVLPREADVHRITGTLWIEPESGALVRGVYRLSRQFDAIRDVPELQEEEAAGEFRNVPGVFKPWTFDLTMIAVDYALWDFAVWLPHSMRMEGEAAAGILKIPVSMDIAYTMESVTTIADVESPEASEPDLEEVHFETRAEAMAFIAQLLSSEDRVAYEAMSESEQASVGRQSLLIVPEERSQVATSPHLPPPIWKEAQGFASDEEVADYFKTLADLPAPPLPGVPWTANWGWARPGLIRYNRVEGPALGARFEVGLSGPHTATALGFFGFADLQPKVRLELERSTVLRRLSLGVYRELHATDPRGGYLGFGNSLDALLFGRDNGDYYRATGADFTWRPPVAARESFELRGYAERQERVDVELNFAVFKVFDGGWQARPNLAADEADEVGAELRLSPWWGGDPLGVQIGLELYGQGARWRIPGESTQTDYCRASAVLRSAVPLASGRWRIGVEAGGGTTWGDAPLQRSWLLGSAGTLRGYPPAVIMGTSFTRGRLELARVFDGIGSLSGFGDVGWAGARTDFAVDDFLYGVGVGASLLDGLFRLDLSRGLSRGLGTWRVDMYADAIL